MKIRSIVTLAPSGNFLVGTCDNEIRVVHRDKVRGELTREMVFLLEVLPEYVGAWVLGLLQSMCYIALLSTSNKKKCPKGQGFHVKMG